MTDIGTFERQEVAWEPTTEVIEHAQLTRFMRQAGIESFDELMRRSTEDVEWFTGEVLKFLDIKFDPPYEKLMDTSRGIEWTRWCTGGGLNISEICLDRWMGTEIENQPAIIWEGEAGEIREISYAELLKEVEYCAAGLRANGIVKGDAVGIHLPMMIETVVALIAIARIGAIAVPVFSGYGVDAIASRFNAVGAKAFISCMGFPRRGKPVWAHMTAWEAASKCADLKKGIILDSWSIHYATLIEKEIKLKEEQQEKARKFLEENPQYKNQTGAVNFNIISVGEKKSLVPTHIDGFAWNDLIKAGKEKSDELSAIEPTSAEDPLIILYTSGTTGKPKGIAHVHCGFPIKAAQDMAFGTDVGRGTRISWVTDIGWMMGPWLIYGALINGATMVLYDGAPDYPTPDRMWEFCARHKVEILGISPTLVRALAASEESGRSADTPVRMSAKHEQPSERKGWYRNNRLPHFDGDRPQFITFRLADSLPREVLEQLKLQLAHDKLDEDSEEYRTRVEEYLDLGAGECILRNPAIAKIVKETLLNEHNTSCDLKAWVIMPNHVHLLLRLREGYDLAGFMKRIKGISARKINELLGQSGSVWQADYFDRYIRDEEHFVKTLNYIRQNPVVAGLVSTAEEWEFGSGDTHVPMSAEHEQAATATKTQSFAASSDADKSVRAPFERHDLSSLRAFASTGEPWNPDPWRWLFEKVGDSKLPIINYSGGTEISGGILMGNPLLPIKPCSFPAPCPGIAADILDENGNPVENGKVGELAIRQPWIGMARGFWQEDERYLDTYWRRFPGIWVHGDWALRDEDGHWFILGRSDDTLKVAGKRVGPAEVESLLVAHPLVTEAAVIGVPDELKGTAMVAFCVLRSADTPVRTDAQRLQPPEEDVSGTLALQSELKALVAKDMGKPLTPSKIHFVSALPKTRNAKVMRRVIRSAYLGEDPGDLSALENPKAVEEIKGITKQN